MKISEIPLKQLLLSPILWSRDCLSLVGVVQVQMKQKCKSSSTQSTQICKSKITFSDHAVCTSNHTLILISHGELVIFYACSRHVSKHNLKLDILIPNLLHVNSSNYPDSTLKCLYDSNTNNELSQDNPLLSLRSIQLPTMQRVWNYMGI